MPDPTYADVLAQFQDFASKQFLFLNEQKAWATGNVLDPNSFSSTGVPGGGGYYPITRIDGTVLYLPSPNTIASATPDAIAQVQAYAAAAQAAAQGGVRTVADYGVQGDLPSGQRYPGMTIFNVEDQRWFDLPNNPAQLGNEYWKTPSWLPPLQYGTIAERNNRIGGYPGWPKDGFQFLQTDVWPFVLWEYRFNGKYDNNGQTIAESGATGRWVSVPRTEDIWAELKKAKVTGLSAETTTDVNDNIRSILTWEGYGDKFEVSWNNYTVLLGSDARMFDSQNSNWAAQTAMLATGDSMLDGKWVEGAAATLGRTLTNVSKYSSGSKQPYRLGVRKLYFTAQSDTIPASGTGVLITSINGVAPTDSGSNNSFDGFAPHGFLNTGSGDTISVHCTESGWFGGRHGVVSVPNAGTPTYTFTPDDGQPASAVAPQSIFVPDNLAKLKTNALLIRSTQNTFFAGPDNPVFPNNINPRVLDDIQLVLDETAGQEITIFSLTPSSSWAPTSAPRIALTYFNNQLLTRWPQYTAYIPGIGTNLDYIRENGRDGSANDQTDYDNNRIPRSCLQDDLHFNLKGQGLERDYYYLWLAYRAAPPLITEGTLIDVKSTATNPRSSVVTTALSSVSAHVDPWVASLILQIKNMQAQIDAM